MWEGGSFEGADTGDAAQDGVQQNTPIRLWAGGVPGPPATWLPHAAWDFSSRTASPRYQPEGTPNHAPVSFTPQP